MDSNNEEIKASKKGVGETERGEVSFKRRADKCLQGDVGSRMGSREKHQQILFRAAGQHAEMGPLGEPGTPEIWVSSHPRPLFPPRQRMPHIRGGPRQRAALQLSTRWPKPAKIRPLSAAAVCIEENGILTNWPSIYKLKKAEGS